MLWLFCPMVSSKKWTFFMEKPGLRGFVWKGIRCQVSGLRDGSAETWILPMAGKPEIKCKNWILSSRVFERECHTNPGWAEKLILFGAFRFWLPCLLSEPLMLPANIGVLESTLARSARNILLSQWCFRIWASGLPSENRCTDRDAREYCQTRRG